MDNTTILTIISIALLWFVISMIRLFIKISKDTPTKNHSA